MKTTILLSASMLILGGTASALKADETPTCAEMGYDTLTSDCLKAGGTPLLCPYGGTGQAATSDKSATESNLCACLTQSCRGYPLTKEGTTYYHLNTDGQKVEVKPDTGKVEDYVDGAMETCVASQGNNQVTYYRVPKCKTGYRYSNDICIEGCGSRYPYDYHPGNLPGTVEECEDANGKWYGYTSCNDGWTPAKPTDGKCNLSSCSIQDYPYMSDPNRQQDRGQTLTCKIGGNAYYRYTNVDKDGKELKENTCALNGYTLSRGVCIADCEINISNCKKTRKQAYKGGDESYYDEWRCGLKEPSKCRLGDRATINGKSIGTIVHLPDSRDDRVLVLGGISQFLKWGDGVTETTKITYQRTDDNKLNSNDFATTNTAYAIKDYNGKSNTYTIMQFKKTNSEYKYPAAEKCYAYTADNCTHDMCKAGQWFLASEGELGYMYDNRYILYNATGDARFYNTWWWSSTEYNSYIAWLVNFDDGSRPAWDKYYSGYVRPVLAF